jgi:hypothetical protein
MKSVEHFILKTVSESPTEGATEKYFLDCEAPMNKVAEWRIRIDSLYHLGLVRLEQDVGDDGWTLFATPRGEVVLAELINDEK